MFFQIIVVLNDTWFTCNVIYCIMFSCWNMLFSCVTISCRWLSLKEIHEDDIKYWKREIPRLMCEMKKYIPPTFSMHKNTTSYTKLRRLKFVDLYTQGQCGWWRGTWNHWRLWLDKVNVLRVLWWRIYGIWIHGVY